MGHISVRQYVLAVFLCTTSLLVQEAQAQKTFTDTEFQFNAQWDTYGPYTTPPDAENVALTVTRRQSGGNPGAHLEIRLAHGNVTEGSVVSWVAFINRTLVWDPAAEADGPLGQLDFKLDARRGEGSGNRALTVAVEQDGYIWMATNKRVFYESDDWGTISIDCLDQLDFFRLPGVNDPGQPLRPDFSAGGSPIAFGIANGQSCPASADCTRPTEREVDVDNFEVTAKNKLPFVINPGLNDAWYNPATDGQGFYAVVFPNLQLLSMAWFTWDIELPPVDASSIVGDPGQRWLLALGPYTGDTATLQLLNYSGGLFDQADPLPGEGTAVGTATVEWCDCGSGTVTYNLPMLGLTGTVPIQRVASDNALICEAFLEADG